MVGISKYKDALLQATWEAGLYGLSTDDITDSSNNTVLYLTICPRRDVLWAYRTFVTPLNGRLMVNGHRRLYQSYLRDLGSISTT